VDALLPLDGGGDEVIAEADERGLCLDRPCSEQDLLAPLRVSPLPAQRPARALDPVDGRTGEAGLLDLIGQAAGGVEVSGGEELRPADELTKLLSRSPERSGSVRPWNTPDSAEPASRSRGCAWGR